MVGVFDENVCQKEINRSSWGWTFLYVHPPLKVLRYPKHLAVYHFVPAAQVQIKIMYFFGNIRYKNGIECVPLTV